jgi:hypothetical protein
MSDTLALELLKVTRAKRWRAYVLNPKTWSDEIWDEACARGLAVRRASRDQSAHTYTLADAGLDLMIEGR